MNKLISFFVIVFSLLSLTHAVHPLSVVTIDFDAEPETRWVGALSVMMNRYGYANSLRPIFTYHNNSDFKGLTPDMYARIGAAVQKNWPIYARELQGLANAFLNTWNITEVSYEYLAAWVYYHEIGHANYTSTLSSSSKGSQQGNNLRRESIFEDSTSQNDQQTQVFSQECTGVLVQVADGTVLQGRNLDQSVASIRNVALHMYLKKGGVQIGDAVDYYWFNAGFVTAYFPGIVSLQSNWRDGQIPIEQLIEQIEAGYTPHVWYFREAVLEKGLNNYNDIVGYLSTIKPMANVYIIMAGISKGQGAIISLDTVKQYPLITLAQQMQNTTTIPDRVFLVQDNSDHWKAADSKRQTAENLLNEFIWWEMTTPLGLFAVMDTYNVHNQNTMYTVIMNPGQKFIQAFGMESISSS